MNKVRGQDIETGVPESINIAITATFTAEPLEVPLRFWMERLGFAPKIAFAPYNQVFQQLLDPNSLLSNNQAGINIVLLRLQDWLRYESTGNGGGAVVRSQSTFRTNIERNVQDLIRILKSAAEH
jgi:hypothetical protein